MPRGAPDGGFQTYTNAGNQTDLGALGDRLLMGGGSAVKTGRIIWATGFEGIDGPTDFLAGGIAQVRKGTDPFQASAWQGEQYFDLLTPATLNSSGYLNKQFTGSMATGRWGIEFMVMVQFNNQPMNIEVQLTHSIRLGLAYRAAIRLSVDVNGNAILYRLDNTGAYVVLKNYGLSLAYGIYMNWKLVADVTNGSYAYFRINNDFYDLTGLPIQNPGAGNGDGGILQISNTAQANASVDAALDNVILTADEP